LQFNILVLLLLYDAAGISSSILFNSNITRTYQPQMANFIRGFTRPPSSQTRTRPETLIWQKGSGFGIWIVCYHCCHSASIACKTV